MMVASGAMLGSGEVTKVVGTTEGQLPGPGRPVGPAGSDDSLEAGKMFMASFSSKVSWRV